MEPSLPIDYNFPTNTHYRTIICQTDKSYETLLVCSHLLPMKSPIPKKTQLLIDFSPPKHKYNSQNFFVVLVAHQRPTNMK